MQGLKKKGRIFICPLKMGLPKTVNIILDV